MAIVESTEGFSRDCCAIRVTVDCSGNPNDIQQCPFWSAKSQNEAAHVRKVRVPTNIPIGMIEEW